MKNSAPAGAIKRVTEGLVEKGFSFERNTYGPMGCALLSCQRGSLRQFVGLTYFPRDRSFGAYVGFADVELSLPIESWLESVLRSASRPVLGWGPAILFPLEFFLPQSRGLLFNPHQSADLERAIALDGNFDWVMGRADLLQLYFHTEPFKSSPIGGVRRYSIMIALLLGAGRSEAEVAALLKPFSRLTINDAEYVGLSLDLIPNISSVIRAAPPSFA